MKKLEPQSSKRRGAGGARPQHVAWSREPGWFRRACSGHGLRTGTVRAPVGCGSGALWILSWSLLLALASTLHAQPTAAPNRVLDLDGRDGYVRLPAAGFTNFHQATIEVWVKHRNFSGSGRVFDFGARQQEIYVGTSLSSATAYSGGMKFLVV